MEIINFRGRYINILGSVDNPYFIGSEIGRILGFMQPHNAIKLHILIYRGVLFQTTPLNFSLLASY